MQITRRSLGRCDGGVGDVDGDDGGGVCGIAQLSMCLWDIK